MNTFQNTGSECSLKQGVVKHAFSGRATGATLRLPVSGRPCTAAQMIKPGTRSGCRMLDRRILAQPDRTRCHAR